MIRASEHRETEKIGRRSCFRPPRSWVFLTLLSGYTVWEGTSKYREGPSLRETFIDVTCSGDRTDNEAHDFLSVRFSESFFPICENLYKAW